MNSLYHLLKKTPCTQNRWNGRLLTSQQKKSYPVECFVHITLGNVKNNWVILSTKLTILISFLSKTTYFQNDITKLYYMMEIDSNWNRLNNNIMKMEMSE